MLVAVRETAMDVSKNLQRDASSGNVRKDRDQRTNFLVDLPKRSVGPSTTQVNTASCLTSSCRPELLFALLM